MRASPAQRLGLSLAFLAVAAALVLGAAAASDNAAGTTSGSAKPLLGITGNVAHYKGATALDPTVVQAFLGWGQGQTYGAPFTQLFTLLGPIPMLHLGTGGTDRKETITPGDIAAGKGDA